MFSREGITQKVHPFPPPSGKDISSIVIDSGNVRIWYAFNALDINKTETYDDLQCLEIGSHISKYYSYFVQNSDSLCVEWSKKHKNAQGIPNWLGPIGKESYWSEYRYSEYFTDFAENTFIEYARMPTYLNRSNCWYSETIPVQDWEIREDTVTIVGYLCQKATCRFRGRNYITWFSSDIPINNGPWKFGGLPGLILKVYDTDQEYQFEFVKIEYFKNKYPISKYNDYKYYTKIEREKLLKFQKDIHEDYIKVAGLIPGKNWRDTYKPEKIVYRPLELE